jgi:hypothetical protein
MSKKLTQELIFSKINNINNDPKNIRFINIWGNQISDISILSSFPSLEKINLNSNQIEDISAFKNLTNIRELSLKDNKIQDFSQIENLKSNKKLEKLNLINNPICNSQNYVKKILDILPQLKELDNINIPNIKLNFGNNNFNSPLMSNKDKNKNNNINNNISPEIDLKNKSGSSESVSSDKKGEAKNVSAAPDPKASFLDDLDSNININQELNINNAYNELQKREKEKNDLLNKSFKKKKTEGSFKKIVKKNIFNSNNKEKSEIKHVINNEENNDKMSQTLSANFYKNPLKKYKDLILNEGGYKKKKIENLKKDHEVKRSNLMSQDQRNTVYKQYQFFDNDNNEFEEDKKKNSYTPKKKKVFQKYNKLRPLITTIKKNESKDEEKNLININEIVAKNSEKNNEENKNSNEKEIINKNIVESIKLLASTLSVEGLKQIQKEILNLLEMKNKN